MQSPGMSSISGDATDYEDVQAHEMFKLYVQFLIVGQHRGLTINRASSLANTPIPLDGNSATIRNFGQNDTNRSRNGKSALEAPRS